MAAAKEDADDKSNTAKLDEFFRRGAVTRIIITSWCGFALVVDPLFLYIPLINEDKKCFTFDPKLKIVALVSRTVVDLSLALPYILTLCQSPDRWLPMTILASSSRFSKLLAERKFLLLSIVAATLTLVTFPIPQMAIVVFFPQMRGSNYLNGTKVFNSLFLLQYGLRAWPTYAFCKNFNKAQLEDKSRNKRWIPCVVNFAIYILASHAFGALWYFFSILREIECWIAACREETGCEFTTFHCDSSDTSTFKNITRVNELCPINPPNATVFDFGIYLGPVQSGIVASIDFPPKFLQCFSWGLRNLSSFASNLNTSNNTWEILFVILVSLSGLLLFIYLLGHLQTFMQAGAETYLIRKKIQGHLPDIKSMVSEYGLPNSFVEPIRTLVEKRLKKDENLVVENIFSILPRRFQEDLKPHLFLDTLKNVPELVNTDTKVLTTIMEHLEPVSYAGDTYIIREGEPLDKMIFVTQGSLLTYDTTITAGKSRSSSIIRLAKGDFYGKELIAWAMTSALVSDFSGLHISTKTVKSHKKVEVFAIKADDLQRIVF